MKLLNKLLLVSLFTLTACNAPSSNNANDIEQLEISAKTTKNGVNKFLCVSMPTGGDSEVVKIFNLQTKELTSLPVPGEVQGMSSDSDNNLIYVNSKSSDGANYSLFKIDTKTKQISRILLFSQIGMRPTDFLVSKNNVYVTGKRSGVGSFYGNDLVKNEWYSIANNINSGKITYGFTEDTYNVISFDDTYLTKSLVNVTNHQITDRKSIEHAIPFGNNVFVPSPHGNYVYILHQLKDSFIPYAFNLKQGTVSRFDEVKTNGGLLYSAIVSNDGKHLLANINREIYHYQLYGTQLKTLPKITLDLPESRNMAMLADNLTLYVTHDSGSSMSIVKFSSDLTQYTISPMYLGGSSSQVFIF